MRSLTAAAASALNILSLVGFAASLRTRFADGGQDGWGGAATASSAAFGGMFLVLLTVSAALAYSIAGSGNGALTSGLNDFSWALVVFSSFPRAMLVMAGSVGLLRAKPLSNAVFGGGGAAAGVGGRGGTTAVWGGV